MAKSAVRIIATSTLKAFTAAQPAADQPIRFWVAVTRKAEWHTPIDVKSSFRQADPLREGRVVFDLGGNNFRLVAKINYRAGIVFIRFIGTHREYDKIDAQTV